MPREIIKKFIPPVNKLERYAFFDKYAHRLLDNRYWGIKRSSVAKSASMGMFMAFLPIPAQTFPALAAAFYLRVNIPISVAMVWITNPITTPPILYGEFIVGKNILGIDTKFDGLNSALSDLGGIGLSILIGSLVFSVAFSLITYFGINWFWAYRIKNKWNKRREKTINP